MAKENREYSQFVEETRKYREDENQLEKAVKECIKKVILADKGGISPVWIKNRQIAGLQTC